MRCTASRMQQKMLKTPTGCSSIIVAASASTVGNAADAPATDRRASSLCRSSHNDGLLLRPRCHRLIDLPWAYADALRIQERKMHKEENKLPMSISKVAAAATSNAKATAVEHSFRGAGTATSNPTQTAWRASQPAVDSFLLLR